MKNNMKISSSVIDIIVIIMFAAYYILPSVSSKYTFMVPLLLGIVYIAFIVILDSMKISTVIIKYTLLIVFIALVYMLFTDASSIAQDVTNRGAKRFISKFYQIFMMFFPILLLNRAEKNFTLKQKKFVLLVSLFLYGYVMLTTAKELTLNPNITRSWSEFSESSTNNIGNYYFVYAIPILIVLCTMFALRIEIIGLKIVMIALIVFQIYFLFIAQYTLSVIIGLLGIGFVLFLNAKKQTSRYFMICIFVFLIILLPSILHFAVAYVPSEQMAVRLNELYNFIVGEDVIGYNLNGRLTLYIDSIKAFLSSPIWGNQSLSFDGHATFLTVLSDTGILGGIPFYYLYFSSNNRVKRIICDNKRQFLPVFIMLLTMGFTNPIHTALPLMYATWFLAPLIISVYNKCERK